MKKKEKKRWLTMCAVSLVPLLFWCAVFVMAAKENAFFICAVFLAIYLFWCISLWTIIRWQSDGPNNLYLVYHTELTVAACYEKLQQTRFDNPIFYHIAWEEAPIHGILKFCGSKRFDLFIRIFNTQYRIILTPQIDQTQIELFFLPDQSRWKQPEIPLAWMDDFLKQKLSALRKAPKSAESR